MRRLIDKALCLLGWPGRHRRRNRRSLLMLMYHGVVPEALSPFCWHQLPRAAFERQLRWIRDNYTVLPLEDALAGLADGALPDHAAAITFDDGFRNNAEVALPVLESLELPATIFMPTQLVGTGDVPWPDRVYLAIAEAGAGTTLDLAEQGLGRHPLGERARRDAVIGIILRALKARPAAEAQRVVGAIENQLGRPADTGAFGVMSWDEAERLAAHPLITLAPHSRMHPILSQCDDARVADEVGGSYNDLVERVGGAPTVFAYPNGRPQDFDARAKQAVTDAGMRYAVTTVNGLADASSDMLALPRMCIGSDLTLDRFRLLVTGAWGALRG